MKVAALRLLVPVILPLTGEAETLSVIGITQTPPVGFVTRLKFAAAGTFAGAIPVGGFNRT